MLKISAEEGIGSERKYSAPVTVPLPKSLPELQHLAHQNFGHHGCLRLYKDGKTLLHHPKQVAELRDGDTVVVRRTEAHRPAARGLPNALSTAQADYKHHPFKAPPAPLGSDDESTLSEISRGAPFSGMSRYARDFIRHPTEKREPCKQPPSLHLGVELGGSTTYAKEFPWRDYVKPPDPAGNDEDSTLTEASRGFRFEGTTCYTNDYQGHSTTRGERAKPLHALSSPRDAKIAQETTYNQDFSGKDSGRMPSARPARQALRNEPFMGSSEYGRQFQRPGFDRLAYIKLVEERMNQAG